MKKIFYLAFIGLVCLTACSDDDADTTDSTPQPTPDFRLESEGSYSGEATMFNSGWTVMNSENVELSVALGLEDTTLTITLDGKALKAMNVLETNNGLSFDLENNTQIVGTDTFLIEGHDGISVSGVKSDGAFYSGSKFIDFYYKLSTNGSFTSYIQVETTMQ